MLKKTVALLLPFLALACARPRDLEYVGLGDLKVLTLGMTESRVGVDAYFYNPNHSGFQFKKASVDIYVNDRYLGRSDLDSLIHVPRQDTFAIPVTLNVKMSNLFPNLLNTVADKQVKVKMDGTVWVRKAGVTLHYPLHYEGMQNIKF